MTVSDDEGVLDWLLRCGFIYIDDRPDAPLGTGRLWAGTDGSDYPIHAEMPPYVRSRLEQIQNG